ncbi:hypothetical protein [Clostridium polynesiense]|uniref:hypothetical protein n=1 Tax=Clostridium polynesiense TaxID=1325933 RepID=UPI00058C195B|nr:hypothetical protein [Clostridium polynesiense]
MFRRNCCCNNNFDVCTVLPLLLILGKSGILKDENAFILLLLFWLCGGVNAFPISGLGCGCQRTRRMCC